MMFQDQIYVPMRLFGENIENSVSQNVFKTNGCILQCKIKGANPFSYNQNFSPGLFALTPGLYTCINSRNL